VPFHIEYIEAELLRAFHLDQSSFPASSCLALGHTHWSSAERLLHVNSHIQHLGFDVGSMHIASSGVEKRKLFWQACHSLRLQSLDLACMNVCPGLKHFPSMNDVYHLIAAQSLQSLGPRISFNFLTFAEDLTAARGESPTGPAMAFPRSCSQGSLVPVHSGHVTGVTRLLASGHPRNSERASIMNRFSNPKQGIWNSPSFA
jgi:hypothetical protein